MVNASRHLSLFVVVGCHSTGSDVASLRDTEPTKDASPEDPQSRPRDAAVGLGSTSAPGTMMGAPVASGADTDAAPPVEPAPTPDDVDASFAKPASKDAGTSSDRLDAGASSCVPEISRCTESGVRERCSVLNGEMEPDGTSCALQLFDGYDGYAVYARRSDGAFAVFSDVPLPEAMTELVASTRVLTIVPDTDPSSLQMPWWIDEERVFRNAVTLDAIENTVNGHSSHGFVLAVGEDGSVSVAGTEMRLQGAYVAALGHAENAWLLASDGTLSPGLDAFTLTPRDWLPTLQGQYQKVFALDLDICGLDVDGEVQCASLDGGEWIERLPAGPFTDMTCNFRTCYLLDEQRDVRCFSPNLECVPHSGPFIDIATSLQLTCGIRPDASVGCWYHNGNELPLESMPAAYR